MNVTSLRFNFHQYFSFCSMKKRVQGWASVIRSRFNNIHLEIDSRLPSNGQLREIDAFDRVENCTIMSCTQCKIISNKKLIKLISTFNLFI